MRIDVGDLEVGSVLRRAFDERIASDSDEVAFDEPVIGEIVVTRLAQAALVAGQAATTTAFVCGRCLEPYRQGLQVTFNEEFVLDAEHEPPPSGELDPGAFAVPLGPSSVLDIGDVIRQHLVLAVPMVPLCTPTCRGLCPQCGVNWNRQSCTCREETIDPRLAPLLQFQERVHERKPGPTGST